jgi:hypothetical protein
MAAASASSRAQRHAIMASPLHELDGFRLSVDCRSAGCGERAYLMCDLAGSFGAATKLRRRQPFGLAVNSRLLLYCNP